MNRRRWHSAAREMLHLVNLRLKHVLFGPHRVAERVRQILKWRSKQPPQKTLNPPPPLRHDAPPHVFRVPGEKSNAACY
jgi:hypothetical protein